MIRRTVFLMFLTITCTVYSQSEYFPELIKFKSETEQNAQYIIKYWNAEAPEYAKAVRLYNTTYGSFDGWIEFCRQEATKSAQSKRYKFNTTKAKQMIVSAIDDANAFNKYIDENDESVRESSRGGGIAAIAAITTGLEVADKVLDFVSLRKEKKRQQKLDLVESELSKLKMESWTDLESAAGSN